MTLQFQQISNFDRIVTGGIMASDLAEQRIDCRRIAKFFERDNFARENGIRIMDVRPGFARTEMGVDLRHINSVGIVQGGAVFTLADLAFALASNSHGLVAVGSQADIVWFKAVRSGRLSAEAEEISRTNRLSTCLIRVTNENGELVALFKGVAYITSKPLDLEADSTGLAR